jgi:hypothetical protein
VNTLLTINAVGAVTGVQLAVFLAIYLAATNRAYTHVADKLAEADAKLRQADARELRNQQEHEANADWRDELWAWSQQLKEREDQAEPKPVNRQRFEYDAEPEWCPPSGELAVIDVSADGMWRTRTATVRASADEVIASDGGWGLISTLHGGHDEPQDDSDLLLFREVSGALVGITAAYEALTQGASMPVPGQPKCHCGQILPCPNHPPRGVVPAALAPLAIKRIHEAVLAGKAA